MCSIFNLTLMDNAEKLACNNHPSNLTNITNMIRDCFYLPEVTGDDLLRPTPGNLRTKKSTAKYGISPMLLERCASYITNPVLQIINTASRTGKVKRSCYTPWKHLRGEDVWLLHLLNIGVRTEWVVSITPRPRFTPGERAPGTHCAGGWVGPRAGLDGGG
jgi:hypothetical protein